LATASKIAETTLRCHPRNTIVS